MSTTLTPAERYSIGLSVLLNMGSLTTLSRESGLSLRQLQELRDDFLAAARRGLEGGDGPATALPVELALHELRLAGDFEAVGDAEAAGAAFQRAIALDPGSGLARKAWGIHLFGQRRLDESRGALEAALERLGEDGECDCVLAMVHRLEGRDREAERLLARGTRRPGLPDYLLGPLVDLHLDLGRTQEALLFLERERALRDGAGGAQAAYAHATLLKRLGRFEEAAEIAEGAVESSGAVPLVLLLASLEVLCLDRPARGIARLRQLVDAWPADPLPRLVLGEMLLATGAHAEAEQELLRVLYRGPANGRAIQAITDLYLSAGNAERLRHIGAELRREGEGVYGGLLIAQAHVAEGRFEDALRELTGLREQVPHNVAVLVLIAHVAFETGDEGSVGSVLGALVDQLARRRGLSPEEEQAALSLCRYLRLNGRPDVSLRVLDALPRPAAGAPGVEVERGLCLAEAGRTEEALVALTAVQQREPFDGIHGTRLAYHLLHHHGDAERARAVITATRRQARPSEEFAVSLCATYLALGSLPEALDVVHEAFLARSKVPVVTTELHRAVQGHSGDLTTPQQLAAHVVMMLRARSPERAAEHLAAARQLARTEAERSVCDQLSRASQVAEERVP
ncbi:MAG: hypothetical protein AMXMBFR64_22510 [Myxococcales bacterium]